MIGDAERVPPSVTDKRQLPPVHLGRRDLCPQQGGNRRDDEGQPDGKSRNMMTRSLNVGLEHAAENMGTAEAVSSRRIARTWLIA
jgi:hypothetical protein